MSPLRLAACLALALRLTESGPAGAAPPAVAATDPALAVAAAVHLEMAWSGLPGLALAVLRDGRLVYRRAFGLANVELRAPMTSSTLVQLSSTSKALTGVAALRLVEQGRLELDRSARSYLDDLPPDWGEVTVRELLSHTSGLPEVLDCPSDSRDDALACVTALPPLDPPGARFRYNQTNYFLVLTILEKVCDRPFRELMAELVFAPAGMVSTVYSGSHLDVVPGRATSYYPDGDGGLRLREFAFPEYLESAAGLNSSLDDLVRFQEALLAGRLLSPQWRERMWRPTSLADGGRSSYGLGWDLHESTPGHRSAGHEGGRLTTIRHFLDDGVSVVVLANGSRWRFDPDELAETVAALFAPRLAADLGAGPGAIRMRLLDDDLAGAVAASRALLAAVRPTPHRAETLINRLGYDLMERRRFADAVALLRLVVERFPDSANAHDSLGEALARSGDRAAALRHYRESLRLDPTNANAEHWIKRLESHADDAERR